jgi:PAS domain S-box-containing protein
MKTPSECLPRAGIALALITGTALLWTIWHAAGARLGATIAGGSALTAAVLGWWVCRRHLVERFRTEAVLHDTEKRFRMAILAGEIGIWDWDLATGKIVWSEMHERLWGLEPGGFKGTYEEFDQRLHPDDRDDLNRTVSRALAERSTYAHEYRIRCPDGSVRWIAGRGEALYDDAGQPRRMMGTVRDITARKDAEAALRQSNEQLERRVNARTAELVEANRELDAFAHSVSHDLRAPLRSITGFGQFLREECAARMDERGRHYLRHMMDAAVRMEALIEDLLQFARASRAELRRQPVDLSALVQEVARELQEGEPKRGVNFTCAPGLRAHGDSRLLRLALVNLLGNAWKYTGKVAEPRVEVGVICNNGHASSDAQASLSVAGRLSPVTFYICDNGVGFDMRYADRLFGAFQRLHSAAEFEGTGVGLATVQRIIHRHGGRIWADAKLNEGATFYFTLAEESRT